MYNIKKEVNVKMKDKTHMSVRVPKDLLKELKIIAIQEDTTVTRIVLDYIEQYVAEHKK